ncbi:hypothetical protein SeMB42_g04516 [Synchytrium endobioticum]|uniref:Uncharacterized protein n=1 Tax=Synchytrium endobioticum TaxID=286115 RepID=A0A507CYD3_9FUNG|nr:hypothetical protein SeMB42_g04516 [Synchytrium endobioticum]
MECDGSGVAMSLPFNVALTVKRRFRANDVDIYGITGVVRIELLVTIMLANTSRNPRQMDFRWRQPFEEASTDTTHYVNIGGGNIGVLVPRSNSVLQGWDRVGFKPRCNTGAVDCFMRALLSRAVRSKEGTVSASNHYCRLQGLIAP